MVFGGFNYNVKLSFLCFNFRKVARLTCSQIFFFYSQINYGRSANFEHDDVLVESDDENVTNYINDLEGETSIGDGVIVPEVDI